MMLQGMQWIEMEDQKKGVLGSDICVEYSEYGKGNSRGGHRNGIAHVLDMVALVLPLHCCCFIQSFRRDPLLGRSFVPLIMFVCSVDL